MKHLLLFIFTLIFISPSFSQDAEEVIKSENQIETTTYYFIRHAEKNRSDKTNRDPNLIQKGLLRAAKWSYVLENVEFDAIYSTDYNRTKQTASPTAEKQGLKITIYDPRDLDIKVFVENTKGKIVLVVGHSNTTPMFVNAILDKKEYQQIADTNNANLYIVTISKSGEVSSTLLHVD